MGKYTLPNWRRIDILVGGRNEPRPQWASPLRSVTELTPESSALLLKVTYIHSCFDTLTVRKLVLVFNHDNVTL